MKKPRLYYLFTFTIFHIAFGSENNPPFYAGPPASEATTIIENTGFTVGYSELHKNPVWVSYRLFKVDDPVSGKRPSKFKVDERTEACVRHDDYTHSGYDRGHIAPNYAIATRFGREAQMVRCLPMKIWLLKCLDMSHWKGSDGINDGLRMSITILNRESTPLMCTYLP